MHSGIRTLDARSLFRPSDRLARIQVGGKTIRSRPFSLLRLLGTQRLYWRPVDDRLRGREEAVRTDSGQAFIYPADALLGIQSAVGSRRRPARPAIYNGPERGDGAQLITDALVIQQVVGQAVSPPGQRE